VRNDAVRRTWGGGCTVSVTPPMVAPGARASESLEVAADRLCCVTSNGSVPVAPGQKGGHAMGNASVRRPTSKSDSTAIASDVDNATADRSAAVTDVGGLTIREEGGHAVRPVVAFGQMRANGGVVSDSRDPSTEIHRTVHGTRFSSTCVPGINSDGTERCATLDGMIIR